MDVVLLGKMQPENMNILGFGMLKLPPKEARHSPFVMTKASIFSTFSVLVATNWGGYHICNTVLYVLRNESLQIASHQCSHNNKNCQVGAS